MSLTLVLVGPVSCVGKLVNKVSLCQSQRLTMKSGTPEIPTKNLSWLKLRHLYSIRASPVMVFRSMGLLYWYTN